MLPSLGCALHRDKYAFGLFGGVLHPAGRCELLGWRSFSEAPSNVALADLTAPLAPGRGRGAGSEVS